MALLAAASLAILIAWIAWFAWVDEMACRQARAEREAGITYVWRGTHLERVEPAAAPERVMSR